MIAFSPAAEPLIGGLGDDRGAKRLQPARHLSTLRFGSIQLGKPRVISAVRTSIS